MIRVLHHVDFMGLGGTERCCLLLLKHLPKGEFEAHAASPVGRLPLGKRLKYAVKRLLGNHKYEGKEEAAAWQSSRVPEFEATLGRQRVHRYERLADLGAAIERVRPQILHVHCLKPGAAPFDPALAAARRAVPVVFATSHFGKEDAALAGRDPAVAVDKVLFVSGWLRDHAKWTAAGDDERYGVLYNPIERPVGDGDLRSELGLGPRTFILGRIGRPSNHIYDPIAVSAFARLAAEGKDLAYVAVAAPPAMREQARTLGVEGRCRFLEPTVDPLRLSRFYRTIDVLAHARRDGETFGCNIAEAFMHGRPCVTHRTARFNAQVELVDEGVTGFVAGEGDVDGYARALSLLAADRERCRGMGAAARLKAERLYEASRVGATLADLYRQALSAKGIAVRAVPS